MAVYIFSLILREISSLHVFFMFEGKFNTNYTFCFPDFFEELEDILKAIEESTFLAVDSEFTGGFPKPLVLFSSFMNVFANIL